MVRFGSYGEVWQVELCAGCERFVVAVWASQVEHCSELAEPRKGVHYEEHYTDHKRLLSLRKRNLSRTASHFCRDCESKDQRERRTLGLALGSAMIATQVQKEHSITKNPTFT